MVGTVQALGLLLLAVLPGAVLVFSYEGRTQRILPGDGNERVLRFLLATVLIFPFVAVVAGAVYVRILHVPLDGGAAHRNRLLDPSDVSLWWTLVPVAYVGVPWGLGRLAGFLRVTREGRRARPTVQTSAWGFIVVDPRPKLVVVKLRSGTWAGGLFGDDSFSSPPESDHVDLVLESGVEVGADGAIRRHGDGMPVLTQAAVVISYADVELMTVEPT